MILNTLYILAIYYFIQKYIVRSEREHQTASVSIAAIALMIIQDRLNPTALYTNAEFASLMVFGFFVPWLIVLYITRRWTLYQIMHLGKKETKD